MASGPFTFVTADVFTSEKYRGHQLAIVSTRNNALPRERKQQIAREFNLAETAFLHDTEPGASRRLDIYSRNEELSFDGQAVIGAAHYIFRELDHEHHIANEEGPWTSTLLTKAGRIPIFFDPRRQVAAAEVPHGVHIHQRETPSDNVLAVQPNLRKNRDVAEMEGSFPLVSFVKGLAFTLVDFTNKPSLLKSLKVGDAPEAYLDDGWGSSYRGCVYYVQLDPDSREEPHINRIRVRMIADGAEDPASGAACSTIACYMALHKGGKGSRHIFAFEQGVEMGRPSQICVEVVLNENGDKVASVTLSGKAVFVTEGKLPRSIL
ncbi:hypothetical protein DTO021D3_4909 [Paecilomyces variotii]|nr:hypothetical protein DTO032I3_1674 [Paecilomyces variotii]KAJ9278175.1 hypothetical protein DTO021D3_4909 [Paecilomyces variotii]KAJ9345539.1 hypothetical protein DTO027B6_2070 [Paecilomyces variotii]KAJ9381577.1 hypothetical protein DTO032I4_6140 [Paecilomyces variotii]